MRRDQHRRIEEAVGLLVGQAQELVALTRKGTNVQTVPPADLESILVGGRNLALLLGAHGEVLRQSLEEPTSGYTNAAGRAHKVLGALIGIQESLARGLFGRIEDLAYADVAGSLLEQADCLLQAGYSLPCAVVCRAVLEEFLREWCQREGCLPTPEGREGRPRPIGMEDLKQALAKSGRITKVIAKAIDKMAAVGNAAAHNTADFDPSDVPGLYGDLVSFIERHMP